MSVSIKINDVEAKNQVKKGSLIINDLINSRTDTCQFKIEKSDDSDIVPLVNQEVIIELDSDRIYGGVIISVEESVVGHNIIEYNVRCKDWTHHLDRELVVERYEDLPAEDIISDMLDSYTTGFTYDGVNAPKVITSIAFNRMTVSKAIEKLAKLLNFYWYVDYNKDVKFFNKNSLSAPFNLTETSENYVYDSLIVSKDISQIKNSIYVRGGESEGLERTETYVADADQTEFPLANKFATAPVVKVDSVVKTVGVDYLDESDDFDFLWNFNQKYIKRGSAFTGGEKVEIIGIPLFPILVNIPSPVSQEEFGVYEFSITDKTIKTKQEAIDRALSELDAYSSSINEASFQTYNAGLKSGQILSINSDFRGINEQFLIQKVDFSMISPDKYVWKIHLATLKTVGIVDVLQKLLLDEEIIEGEQENLLTYLQFNDSADISDSFDSFTKTYPPYVIDDDAESEENPLVINFGTISSG